MRSAQKKIEPLQGRIKDAHAISFKMITVIFLITLSFIFIVYYPSLGQSYRGDHWIWLGDTCQLENYFPEIFSETYSYNRQRVLYPGDFQLYRPLLFACLAFKQVVFGHITFLHQLFNLLVYLAFLTFVFLVMLSIPDTKNSIKKSTSFSPVHCAIVSCISIFFISVNPINYELVTWSHISGYLVSYFLIFGALFLVAREVKEYPPSVKMLFAPVSMLTISCFFYEITQAVCLVFGFSLMLAVKKSSILRRFTYFLLFCFPICIYQIFNRIDYHDKIISDVSGTIPSLVDFFKIDPSEISKGIFLILKFLALNPFTTSIPDMQASPLGRTFVFMSSFNALDLAIIFVIILAALSGIFYLTHAGPAGLFLIFCMGGMFFINPAAMLFRTIRHPQGESLVYESSYYAILPMVSILFFATASIQFWKWNDMRFLKIIGVTAQLIIAILALHNSNNIFVFSKLNVDATQNFQSKINHIDSLINGLPKNQRKIRFESEQVPAIHGIPITTILWGRYENPDNSIYTINFNTQKMVPTQQYQATLAEIPKLVSVGGKAHLWEYNHSFFCLPYSATYPAVGQDIKMENGLSRQQAVKIFSEMNRIPAYRSQSIFQ